MNRSDAELFTLRVDGAHTVSGLLSAPPHPRACYVLAHGAGAGMFHPFMEAVATELAQRAIATLRYQFPFMEQGAKRPDPPKLAHATVRAAVAEAGRILPAVALVAGGENFGGGLEARGRAGGPPPRGRGPGVFGFRARPRRGRSGARAEPAPPDE